MERWDPGDAIALREVFHGRLWTARAATVVEDAADRTMLFIPPGMRWKCPRSPDGSWQRVPSRTWTLDDRVWEGKRVLSFAWPGVAHAVLLYWAEDDGRFLGWYVNLQSPLSRTAIGFDYMDDMLDIEVEPDRTWRWKDEEELASCVERGLWTADQATEIRAEGERAIERLEARDEPFDDRWLGWLPDPAWGIPALPPAWDELERADPGTGD